MNLDFIKLKVLEKYDIKAVNLERIKNVYKIRTLDNIYCLKIIKYEFAHFKFIISVIEHLQKNGFKKIPEIIRASDGEMFISIDKCYAYLTYWIDARECNYDNPIDVKIATKKLAEFHLKSRGFKVDATMKPRIGWGLWIEKFSNRINEIEDFRKIIYKKDKYTEFDKLYLDNIDEQINSCKEAVNNLKHYNYIQKMKDEMKSEEICHHDFAHHNVLIERDGSVNFIDFDYAILDSHLHDLSSFLIRTMKAGKWSIDKARQILHEYSLMYPLCKEDILIMAAFMEFSQGFWQLGIQMYYEHLEWDECQFLRRLNNYIDDIEDRKDFISEFRRLSFI